MELPDRLADRYQCHRDRKLECINKTRRDRSVVVYIVLYAHGIILCKKTVIKNLFTYGQFLTDLVSPP